VPLDSLLFNDFFNARALVLNSLTNVFESQIAGAKGDGLRDALGDKSGLNAAESRERDRGTVVGMETFGFDELWADKAWL